jgi:hypothetical protein
MAALPVSAGNAPNTDWVEFQRKLNTVAERAVLNQPRWAPFTSYYYNGLTTANGVYSGKKNQKAKVGEVISMKGEFTKNKTIVMDQSVLYPADGDGVRGNERLKGNENRAYYAHQSAVINGYRWAYLDEDGIMDQQLMAAELYKMLSDGTKHCKNHLSDYVGLDVLLSILLGYSPHCIGTKAQGGVGVTAKSNPNILVKGFGEVSETPVFGSTYENAVSAALATLSGLESQQTNLEFIQDLLFYANQKKVQPALGDLHLVVMQNASLRNLTRDPDFKIVHKDANVRGMENPLLNGMWDLYRIENAIIMVDATVPSENRRRYSSHRRGRLQRDQRRTA